VSDNESAAESRVRTRQRSNSGLSDHGQNANHVASPEASPNHGGGDGDDRKSDVDDVELALLRHPSRQRNHATKNQKSTRDPPPSLGPSLRALANIEEEEPEVESDVKPDVGILEEAKPVIKEEPASLSKPAEPQRRTYGGARASRLKAAEVVKQEEPDSKPAPRDLSLVPDADHDAPGLTSLARARTVASDMHVEAELKSDIRNRGERNPGASASQPVQSPAKPALVPL
jgi:hypothetical protein